MAKLDSRGSKAQQLLYNLACKAFHPLEVIYEYPLGELRQRIDIFIPALGVAIEYDGVQHDKYNSFFFKDASAWENAVMLDKRKEEYLEIKGVRLLRLKHNTKIATPEELKDAVDALDEPAYEYTFDLPTQSASAASFKEKKKQQLQDQKEKRKELTKKANDSLKEKRKELYKIQKEKEKELRLKNKKQRAAAF